MVSDATSRNAPSAEARFSRLATWPSRISRKAAHVKSAKARGYALEARARALTSPRMSFKAVKIVASVRLRNL